MDIAGFFVKRFMLCTFVFLGRTMVNEPIAIRNIDATARTDIVLTRTFTGKQIKMAN